MRKFISIGTLIFASVPAFASHPVRSATEDPDPGYRVVMQPNAAVHGQSPFPRSTEKWELHYQFVVPQIPSAKSWDYKNQVFYIWGDVDFDTYGSSGSSPLSHYWISQIVPQLMIGNSLAKSDANYSPSWVQYDSWVIQAQYYWADKDHTDYAQCGKVISVVPGDSITTSIRYNPADGEIIATISAPEGESSITIPRPFPNEKQPLFSSWKDFFAQAEAKTPHVMGQAVINVESHDLDQATMCSVLPFEIQAMSGASFPKASSDFLIRTEGGFVCPTPFTKIDF